MNNNIPGYKEYLDMDKWYYILVPVNAEANDALSDYHSVIVVMFDLIKGLVKGQQMLFGSIL